MKQPKLYLSHIIKAINTIQEYLKGFSYKSFLKWEAATKETPQLKKLLQPVVEKLKD